MEKGLRRVSGTEIKPEERQAILELHAKLPGLNHFELLGVDRRADPARIKEAYFELSRRFHPDRYFGVDLGDLRPAIDAIFRRLKEAESTLSDPVRRREYAAAHPEARSAAQLAQDEITAKRRAERSARLRRLDPLARRALNAAELAARGRQQLESGSFAEAAATLSLAASLRGRSPELEKAAAEAARKAALEKARGLLKSAKRAELAGEFEAARGHFLEAATIGAGDVSLQLQALNGYLDRGGDPAGARTLVSGLLAAAPENADAHALQGRLLLAAGHEKAGNMALDRALKLDPNQPFARSARRKPRWPFK